MDLSGGADGVTRSMTIAWSRVGRDQVQLLRERLDPFRGAQRLDLEPQVAVDLLLGRASAACSRWIW